MTDLTQRIINALRRAVISARNADEAKEAAELADALEAGAPANSEQAIVAALSAVAVPVVEMTAEPAKAQEVAPPAPEVVHTS